VAVVTFSFAASALGFKSRSTLYRLRDDGSLDDYLRPPDSPGQAQRLELTPPGLPSLAERVGRILRPQTDNAFLRRSARPGLDRRWEQVAELLGEAVGSAIGITPEEARAMAEALPEAMREAFGAGGLEWLREALSAQGLAWRVGPGAHERNDPWWQDGDHFLPSESENGRKFLVEELGGRFEENAQPFDPDDEELWEQVAGILSNPWMRNYEEEPLRGSIVKRDLESMLFAVDAVQRGCRYSLKGNAVLAFKTLKEYTNIGCYDYVQVLAPLLIRGHLPPELQEQAREEMGQAIAYWEADPKDQSEHISDEDRNHAREAIRKYREWLAGGTAGD